MMVLRRPALLGAGEGSCDLPTGSAGSCACYIDGTRAQGVDTGHKALCPVSYYRSQTALLAIGDRSSSNGLYM